MSSTRSSSADFRNKIDAFPNRYTSMTFTPLFATPHADGTSQVGTIYEEPDPADPTKKKNFSAQFTHRDHYLFCAEYCGDNHSDMAGIVRVVSKEDLPDDHEEVGGISREPSRLSRSARPTSRPKGCAACHTVDGTILAAPS